MLSSTRFYQPRCEFRHRLINELETTRKKSEAKGIKTPKKEPWTNTREFSHKLRLYGYVTQSSSNKQPDYAFKWFPIYKTIRIAKEGVFFYHRRRFSKKKSKYSGKIKEYHLTRCIMAKRFVYSDPSPVQFAIPV